MFDLDTITNLELVMLVDALFLVDSTADDCTLPLRTVSSVSTIPINRKMFKLKINLK